MNKNSILSNIYKYENLTFIMKSGKRVLANYNPKSYKCFYTNFWEFSYGS